MFWAILISTILKRIIKIFFTKQYLDYYEGKQIYYVESFYYIFIRFFWWADLFLNIIIYIWKTITTILFKFGIYSFRSAQDDKFSIVFSSIIGNLIIAIDFLTIGWILVTFK